MLKENLDPSFRKEVETWITNHYLARSETLLKRVKNSSRRLQMERGLVELVLLVLWFWAAIFFGISWYVFLPGVIATLAAVWFVTGQMFFSSQEAIELIEEELKEETKLAKAELPPLTYDEQQEVKRLINVSKSKVGERVFKEELKEALKFEGLRKWVFIQDLCKEFEVSQA